MKQTAVEFIFEELENRENGSYSFTMEQIYNKAKEIQKQQKGYSEEEMLELLHKFGFDYTYNYKGEKTIYEWIPEWFEEYKRLNN
jgi:hypothetical protein